MAAPSPTATKRSGLFDLAMVTARQLRVLVAVTAVGTVLSVALALLLPQWYSAAITMLPAPKSSKLSPLVGALGGKGGGAAAALPLDLLGIDAGGDSWVLVGVLKSRTVTDAVIHKYDLQRVYDRKTIEDTRKELGHHVGIDCDRKTNIVKVEVEDRVPTRARDMALTFADEANRIHNHLEMTQAGQERRFLDQRLVDVKKDLTAAETAMQQFQSEHGLVDLNEQTKATVRAVANLRAELMSREIQQTFYSSYAAGNEQNALRVRREMAEIRRQLDKLEHPSVDGGKGKAAAAQGVTPVAEIPQLALEYLRRMRELKIQETLFELLTKNHELAKLAEVRDTGTVQIIDQPIVATKRARPKRGEVVIIGFVLSLMLAFSIAWVRDGAQRDPARRRRWRELWSAVRGRPAPPHTDA